MKENEAKSPALGFENSFILLSIQFSDSSKTLTDLKQSNLSLKTVITKFFKREKQRRTKEERVKRVRRVRQEFGYSWVCLVKLNYYLSSLGLIWSRPNYIGWILSPLLRTERNH